MSEEMKTYAVTLKSKFTAMIVVFGCVRAVNPALAKTIALTCMNRPEAWEADGAVEQRPQAV
jgi:hypothetical protein